MSIFNQPIIEGAHFRCKLLVRDRKKYFPGLVWCGVVAMSGVILIESKFSVSSGGRPQLLQNPN